MITLEQAEVNDGGHIVVVVKAGTRVDLGRGGWVATVTQEGLDCDCGKGVLCPLNPQVQDLSYSRVTLLEDLLTAVQQSLGGLPDHPWIPGAAIGPVMAALQALDAVPTGSTPN